MNKFLALAGVCLLCSLMNLFNVYLTGNGFSLVLGLVWLGASAYVYLQYRKMKKKNDGEEAA